MGKEAACLMWKVTWTMVRKAVIPMKTSLKLQSYSRPVTQHQLHYLLVLAQAGDEVLGN